MPGPAGFGIESLKANYKILSRQTAADCSGAASRHTISASPAGAVWSIWSIDRTSRLPAQAAGFYRTISLQDVSLWRQRRVPSPNLAARGSDGPFLLDRPLHRSISPCLRNTFPSKPPAVPPRAAILVIYSPLSKLKHPRPATWVICSQRTNQISLPRGPRRQPPDHACRERPNRENSVG